MGKPILHAAFLVAWADGKAVEMQYPDSNVWYLVENDQELNLFEEPDFKFRIKPRTILINGIEVPEPFRGCLESGQTYWCVHFSYDDGYAPDDWDGSKYQANRLKNGAAHLTKEAAEIHARALLSFTKIKDE